MEASAPGRLPGRFSTITNPLQKGVLSVAYFTITDGNGTSVDVDLTTNDPAMIAQAFKQFEAKQKANKKDQEKN
ncbi:hypothetical protein PSCSP1s_00002 [Prochlorococcus phage P-SCSP1s]|nr:hypothetical protein PSCSP1s_00002 [Prochlorococcus phage P-SCSP1s]